MIKREIPVIGISTEIDIPGRISVKRKYVDVWGTERNVY